MISTTRNIFTLGLLIFAANVLCLWAATPDDYKVRLESARFDIEQLIRHPDEAPPEDERDLIRDITSVLPAAETIEWPGGKLDTDNRWLHERLKELSAESDRSKRIAILSGISERLLALSVSAGQLEGDLAEPRSKDEDKQKLAEILGRQEYKKPEPQAESRIERWWREFLEWLARQFPSQPQNETTSIPGLGSLQFILQVVILAAVVALVGFLIYKFAPFIGRGFRRSRKAGRDARVILGERIEGDESASDIFDEAESLARAGDLRAAIRKGYIAALCDMADRKIVRLARHKTNRDYLRDVRKSGDIFEHLSGLTLSFENNWYGLKTAEMADWEEFRTRYHKMMSDARRSAR